MIPVREKAGRILKARWTPLKYHYQQARLWSSRARFEVVPPGRQSGKTEIAGKRKPVLESFLDTDPDAWYIFAAPTHAQAKRIYWADLKRMIPRAFMLGGRPIETELTIPLLWGPRLSVIGMDEPARIEGRYVKRFVFDEFANMKPEAWYEHLRPCLSTPGKIPGRGSFVGVPEGRNHYYDLYRRAQSEDWPEWDVFHWVSADIMDPDEIEEAKRELDERTFRQEYEGSFESFEGLAYAPPFHWETHAHETLDYDPTIPIHVFFDFNQRPGVAGVIQEQVYTGPNPEVIRNEPIPMVLSRVFIDAHSKTPIVCDRLKKDWAKRHHGDVFCYGDATGGAGGSAKVEGSDWDIIKKSFRQVQNWNVRFRVPKQNPRERVRVNTVCSFLRNVEGKARILVDPRKPKGDQFMGAWEVARDLDEVETVPGGSGELVKPKAGDAKYYLTHLTDGLGYYLQTRWADRKKGKRRAF